MTKTLVPLDVTSRVAQDFGFVNHLPSEATRTGRLLHKILPFLCRVYRQQLGMEAQAVSAKAAELSGAQDQKRTNDQIATGVAIVVFWPAAFLVGGDGQVAAQLSQMKGQMAAIEQASIQKKCGIQFRQAPPPQS